MRVGCQIRLQTHRRHASAALGRLGGLTPESHHAYFQILPLPDYGLPAKIWNGWDAIHVEQNLGLSALAVTDAGAQLSEQPIVQIMGHYNSGTNLLVALLEKSFHGQAKSNSLYGPFEPLFWKHASVSALREMNRSKFAPWVSQWFGNGLDDESLNATVGIAMVRNPLSWLRSFRNASYDLKHCSLGNDWLTRPCTYPDWNDLDDKRMEPSLSGRKYANLEQIWNEWMQDYVSLQDFGFKNAAYIRYEDLVLDATETISRMFMDLNLSVPEFAPTQDTDARNFDADGNFVIHTEANARAKALKKIKSKSYLSEFTKDELVDACSRLDKDLMHQLGYDDCDIVQPP